MDGFPETQGKILTNSSKFFENSSKILSKLKQNPEKLNLPQIPVTLLLQKRLKKAWLRKDVVFAKSSIFSILFSSYSNVDIELIL